MKIICVNQNIFLKTIGYGLSILATIGVIYVLIGSNYEISTIHGDCLNQFITNIEYCGDNDVGNLRVVSVYARFDASIVTLCIGIGGWFIWYYFKQQRFRFSWCDEESQKNQKGMIKP